MKLYRATKTAIKEVNATPAKGIVHYDSYIEPIKSMFYIWCETEEQAKIEQQKL